MLKGLEIATDYIENVDELLGRVKRKSLSNALQLDWSSLYRIPFLLNVLALNS